MSVPVRNDVHGTGIGTASRKRTESASWPIDNKQICGTCHGAGRDCGNPKLFSNDSYGRRFCQFRANDVTAVDQCYHGCEHRDNGNCMDFKPCGDRQQEFLCQSAEAIFVHANSCTDWHCVLYDVKKQQTKRHRHDSPWVCDTNVRNGSNVRCCFRSSERSRVSAVVPCVYEPASWRSCRSDPYRHHSVKLSIRWYFAGACFYRSGYIRRCRSNYYGAEYRNLCYGVDFIGRNK